MKLTQKTLFQCFDKSKKESTVILSDTDTDEGMNNDYAKKFNFSYS